MSSELNKIFCAILSAILVYLLASFLSELLYSVDKKNVIKLSYNILKMKISVISHLRCRGDQSIRLTEAGVQKENQAVLKRSSFQLFP